MCIMCVIQVYPSGCIIYIMCVIQYIDELDMLYISDLSDYENMNCIYNIVYIRAPRHIEEYPSPDPFNPLNPSGSLCA